MSWRVPSVAGPLLGAALGLVAGVGGYTFVYAKGAAYLTNDPQACVNCHVMREEFEGWVKSSHRAVAVCNDCHTPHDAIGRYTTKGLNGFWHSFYFTTQSFHEPIQIGPRNRAITESACRRCHAEVVQAIDAQHSPGRELSCIFCHRDVGHLH